MYSPLSALFLPAVRRPPAIAVRVEVWRGGARVDTYGDAGIPIYGGEVQVDGTKSTQRSLSGLKVDATDEMWSLLSPPGTRLYCYRGFEYGPGSSELVPVGRFCLGSLTENYGGDWDGSVDSAPDLMDLVDRAGLPSPRAFAAGTAITTVISTLLSEVLGTATVTATSTATLPSTAVYEQDRLGAITTLADSIGAMVWVAADGTPMVTDTPTLAADGVWDVDTGDDGIMYSAARQRSTDRAYSAVSVASTSVDGSVTFAPQVAYDTNPASPTYYLGDFGLRTYFITGETYGSAAQALAAAQAKLPLVTALNAEATLQAECNPALVAWDTINIHFPRRLRGQTAVTERHMVGGFTVPLTPDGVQQITTRSSVADLP